MKKLISFTVGFIGMALISGFTLAKSNISDVYQDVVVKERYIVKVCKEERLTQADVAAGAFWGAVFGAIAGDVVDEEDGRVPGAIIGATIGAKTAEDKASGTQTMTVCENEVRYNEVTKEVYSHSVIKFSYQDNKYELDFIK